MKTHPTLLTLLAGALVLAASPAGAEDAKAIFNKHEGMKAEALEAYLKANPEAEDAGLAEEFLIKSYLATEQTGKASPLMRKRYDSMSKGDDANLRVLIGNIILPLFQAYLQAGDKDEARKFLTQAKRDLATHPQGMQIARSFDGELAKLDMLGVGDVMAISGTAIDDRKVDLAEMKGKVVLVDFWATWCAPCVAELPNVVAAYDKYHDKGFEIVGVSLDSDKGALDGFIEQRKLPWPQLFDGKGWQNEIAVKFGIKSIPATYLIGKDGKIAATNLRGAALEQKVGELLGGE